MIPVYKGIAVFMLCMLPPAVAGAQNPAVEAEDYTSDISFCSVGNISAIQQVGSPLMIPENDSGNDNLFLFAVLTGVSSSASGISPVIIDSNSVALHYDRSGRKLTVRRGSGVGNCRLNVVGTDGRLVDSRAISGQETEIDLASFPPGTYTAGIISSDKYVKHLKFIMK